ncbi:MAG: sel1 repeat family protein, partial [Candidatus Riflebacteria bacterium]|nr:sel1 repeat family protein [Candidatus Riflebacteria bacterium]
MKNLTSIFFTCFIFVSSLCCAENIPEIMNKAKQGDAEAQFKIAALYASGKIGKKDQESQSIMLDWLEKSASQNYAKAQNILYKKYFQLEKFEKAAKWAKEAIKRKDKSAMSVMAYLNYFGCRGVPINMKKAFELSGQSMDQPLSQVVQGRFYLNGCENFEKDISQAKDCAEKAIKMKNPYGYVLMADIYMSSNEVDDEVLRNAEQNLQEAVKMDCSEAMVKLADLYLDNYGTAEKTVKATNLYVQASKFLNPASFRQLALYVLEKNKTDVVAKYQSMEALKDAAKYGDPQAQVLLWECCTTNKYGFETDNALAKQYMAEAINSGDPEALYDFAMILKRMENSSDNKD